MTRSRALRVLAACCLVGWTTAPLRAVEVPLNQVGRPIAWVTGPTGGGNHDIEVIRDGVKPATVIGTNAGSSAEQYDTYHGGADEPEDWIGYEFDCEIEFTRVVFQEGKHFFDGGYFDPPETLIVQVRETSSGSWVDATGEWDPPYEGEFTAGEIVAFETFTMELDPPLSGDAIRILGDPGGAAAFISVAELEVFGELESGPPAAVAAAAPLSGAAPLEVTFDATGSSGSGLVYDWDFGDGESGTGSSPTHTFERAGSYVVTLTATSEIGDCTFVDQDTVTVFVGTNLASLGRVIARITAPTGGGNHDINVIRDGVRPDTTTGQNAGDSALQYDTVVGGQTKAEDWIGYEFDCEVPFASLVFQEGKHFFDGGYFEPGTLEVQYRDAVTGDWLLAPGEWDPPYPGEFTDGVIVNFETFTWLFDDDVLGDAIRIYGLPGGSATFTSVAELEVWAQLTTGPEEVLESGALNCGGPEVDATDELGFVFRPDTGFGESGGCEGSVETGVTIHNARLGRIARGADFTNTNAREIEVSRIPGAGDATAALFATDSWSTAAVHYRAEVVPGRYEVTLYWAENNLGAIGGQGQGTRLYDVLLSGERVLCNWSVAAAAGSEAGSGDPSVPCVGASDVAIARTFTLDIEDGGDGYGTLDIVVKDLGGGNPPENAGLNALSFTRAGPTTGEEVGGDVECIGTGPAADPDDVLIDEDFEGGSEGACPSGMVCNSNSVSPQVAGGRLRLIDDTVADTGATAIFEETVDVVHHRLEAEFDLYMSNPDGGGDPAAAGAEAADGASFFVMQGTNTASLGAAGGALGIPVNQHGFTVEFDTWLGGGGGTDPSGFNSTSPWTHVGINNMSTQSVITSSEYDPSLIPVSAGGSGWPNFFDIDGVHVRVVYDAGHVTVTLSGVTEDLDPFGPTVVAEADVVPIFEPEAVVGFSGGTGSRTQDAEVDNVVIRGTEGVADSGPVGQALAEARTRWNGGQGSLFINCGGPTLVCSAHENPAPGATGDAGTGEAVVWVGDQAGGGSLDTCVGEFFEVMPVPDVGGAVSGLAVAGTNMGSWDARGTEPGVDDNDRIFHSERYNDLEYSIPVPAGEYEVTLYFANSHDGTAGTARRFFHVLLEDVVQADFEHCEFIYTGPIVTTPNPLYGYDDLFDPVDAAEQLYSASPCVADGTSTCAVNGVTSAADPDADLIPAGEECGNAAAVALRYRVEVTDGALSIALTEPDPAAGEPASPDGNPKISGISVRGGGGESAVFRRGDADASGAINITDGIFVLNFLFLGGPDPVCLDAADSDDSGAINITDGIFVLNFLFLGGPNPPAPGTDACGSDPTADDLECVTYDEC